MNHVMISDIREHLPETCCRPSATDASSEIDLPRIERAVREILFAIGEDPDRDGLLDTPSRVARSYEEIYGGLRQSPDAHLRRVFDEHADEVITLSGIDIYSVCEHHLLPFIGKAHVAYLPQDGQVVGLSKLARTVDVFARRPQIQERLTSQVADALMEHAGARGALVVIEAEHYCMKMRGVRTADSVMTTYARRGALRDDADLCNQVMALLDKHRG